MTPLLYLQHQRERMIETACRWANLNSGSRNLPGLAAVSEVILHAFELVAPDAAERLWIPETGDAKIPLLILRKRATAPRQVFFFGHLDTVFGREHPFQKVARLDEGRIRGPGLCDM